MKPTRLRLQPGLSTLTLADEALQSASEELAADLHDVADLRIIREDTPAPGKKGQWSDVILALGGPSAVAGVVRIFHLWLDRDRRRSLTLIKDLGGEKPLTIKITGDSVSEATVRDAVQQLIRAAEADIPAPVEAHKVDGS